MACAGVLIALLVSAVVVLVCSLRRALAIDRALALSIQPSPDTGALLLRISTIAPVRRAIIEAISLPRAAATALGMRPPSGFTETPHDVPSEAAFEPDLDELADEGIALHGTLVEAERRRQFVHAATAVAALNTSEVSYAGSMVVRGSRVIELPVANLVAVRGSVTISCRCRVGVLTHLSGYSIDLFPASSTADRSTGAATTPAPPPAP
jgi:hypothetical protein